MSFITRVADTFAAIKFLKILTTPWKKTKAYKLGLVDEDGVTLKKAKTTVEKEAHTSLTRLVFNIKRLLGKLPFGKKTITSYAAALYLIKESQELSPDLISLILEEATDVDTNDIRPLYESVAPVEVGEYISVQPLFNSKLEEVSPGALISVTENTAAEDYIFGVPIYKLRNADCFLYGSMSDIEKLS